MDPGVKCGVHRVTSSRIGINQPEMGCLSQYVQWVFPASHYLKEKSRGIIPGLVDLKSKSRPWISV